MRHRGKTYWRRRLDKVLAERLVFEGRVLKPGGLFYLTVPFCFPRHGVEYYRFSELALADMLEGYEVDIVPVRKSKFWNRVWNYFPDDTLVEGYFVKARKRPA